MTTGLDRPRAIAVDSTNGKIYWTDIGSGKIQRANLDGSGSADFVTGLGYPVAISADEIEGKIYWIDTYTCKISQANTDGSGVCDVVGKHFTGVFDGDGHTISNFTYNSYGSGCTGIFGYIGQGAVVKGLRLLNPDIVSDTEMNAGSLAGGLIGGSVINCFVEGGSIAGDWKVGGLVGYSRYGIILDCHSTAEIGGDNYVGGLVGYHNYGSIYRCHSTGSVTGSYDVGGLVGHVFNGGDICESYCSGDVSGGTHTGGLIGNLFNRGSISDCYCSGEVSGSTSVGGLVGYMFSGEISKSYSSSIVSGNKEVGGLVGYDNFLEGDYTACFWDSDINPSLDGISNMSDPGVTGLPTMDMQTESAFTDAGWDFVDESINGDLDIWRLCNEGAEYPHLNWEYPSGDFGCPDGVDFVDFAVFGDAWFSGAGDSNWDAGCDISEPEDGVIDGRDLEVFVNNWLEGV